MTPFGETSRENNAQYDEEIGQWYQCVLDQLRRDEFEPTPAEAVHLRRIIRKCLDENDAIRQEEKASGKQRMDRSFTYPEIFERFFSELYGINIDEYLRSIKPEERKQARKELFRYVQEKLRKDGELM